MARLNEPPLSSTDTIETLRKKMLRQNRELAKCNNVRALRIRELEGELACAISENLELRGRILELENEAQDNESRRIADHAMIIKEKLESQLTEWGTLLAGLGLEPPMKRHSPRVRKSTRPRLSFSANRPSPSQRRLRDVAREIQELGHISEHKTYSRGSMGPEQILALRSEADADEPSAMRQPKLARKPQVIAQSPPREKPLLGNLLETITFPSPPADSQSPVPESPQNQSPPPNPESPTPASKTETSDTAPTKPLKAGHKRKLDSRDEVESVLAVNDENDEPRVSKGRVPLREKAYGKSLKELASMRRDARFRQDTAKPTRKPLSARSTNDDVSSPRKMSKTAALDEKPAKKTIHKSTPMERPKPRARAIFPIPMEPLSKDSTPALIDIKETSLEPQVLSSVSPEPNEQVDDGQRDDTPPPVDISSNGDMSRGSRRSRPAVSYAEPNLRDKMRRPTKELFDAVAGEGKSRRWSQSEPLSFDHLPVKRESVSGGESLRKIAMAKGLLDVSKADQAQDSPLARKATSAEPPAAVKETQRKRRASSAVAASKISADISSNDEGDSGDIDVYEFESSSPKIEEAQASSKSKRGKSSSRRFSTAVDSMEGSVTRERTSRRRSMMV